MKKEYLTLLVCFVLFSCQKELHVIKERFSSITNTGLEQELLNYYNEEGDGEIIIHGGSAINGRASNKLSILAGFGLDTIENLQFNHISINKSETFNGISYYNTNQDPDIFGTELTFQISSDYPEVSVYLPERIYGSYSHDVLKAGNTITWNADPLNEKGVLVVVRYMPDFQIPADEEGEDIITYALVEDNGSYQLPASLFDGIPPGSNFVEISLNRGDLEIILSNDESRTIKFLAYSASFNVYTYENE